jgi:hypothetical protein
VETRNRGCPAPGKTPFRSPFRAGTHSHYGDLSWFARVWPYRPSPCSADKDTPGSFSRHVAFRLRNCALAVGDASQESHALGAFLRL